MSPTPGTRLGPYEIDSSLGGGGMGEVYRATDTKLKRDVAPLEWSGFAPVPNGDRFLLLEPAGSRSRSLTLVDNWRAQLAPQR